MKKFIYIIGVLTLSFISLIGCTNDKKESKANNEVKQAYTNEEEKLPMYWKTYYQERLVSFSKTMKELSDKFSDINKDPTLTKEQQWQDEVNNLANRMSIEVKELKDYKGKVPKEFEEMHFTLISSMDEYQYVADNLSGAVLALSKDNSDLFNKCTDKLEKGNMKMNKATELFDKIEK